MEDLCGDHVCDGSGRCARNDSHRGYEVSLPLGTGCGPGDDIIAAVSEAHLE